MMCGNAFMWHTGFFFLVRKGKRGGAAGLVDAKVVPLIYAMRKHRSCVGCFLVRV